MGREEVQDQLNDAEKYDICAIDILSHYRKYSSGKMMMIKPPQSAKKRRRMVKVLWMSLPLWPIK